MAWFTASSAHVTVVIFASLLSSQALSSPCPPGWLQWQQSCYIVHPDKMNWLEASEACDRPGSSLVVPNTREENCFIWASLARGSGLWIGCTDAAQEGNWTCGGQPALYTNWRDDRFKQDSEHNCARLTIYEPDGAWADDVPCGSTDRKWAACEMSPPAVPAYHASIGPGGRVRRRCLLHHDTGNRKGGDGVLGCGWACRADPRCRSFNLWQGSEGGNVCQFNNITRLGASGADFEATNNCYYFEL